MKLVIAHNGVKRIIYGTGFNICASREDLETIAEVIAKLPEGFSYGWVKVRDPVKDEHSAGPDTTPSPWSSD